MPDSSPNPPSRSRTWAAVSIAAGLAIAVAALVAQNHALNDELRDESNLVSNLAGKASKAQQVFEVLASSGAERVILSPEKSPRQPVGGAIYLPDRGGLIFMAAGLQPPPSGKTYELWILPASGKPAIPAGEFVPDASGSAHLVLPQVPYGVPAKSFAVTTEKPGGVSVPTLPVDLSGEVAGN